MFSFVGVSKELIYTFLNQLWRIISGPFMLIFIPLFLTVEEQGYWYIFISISALSVIADMGFSIIILQFSAQEFAFLRFEKNCFIGESIYQEKLASLFVFAIRWLSIVILIVFPIILIIGVYILDGKEQFIIWKTPWVLYSIASAVIFFYSCIFSFFEGCGFLALIQKVRLFTFVITSITNIGLLYLGFHLYAIAYSSIINVFFVLLVFKKMFWKIAQQLYFNGLKSKYSWKKEILQLLSKYMVGAVSSYLFSQIYVPIAFHYYGAVEAGKIGISIALWSALMNISNSWIYSIIPKMNIYIAKKQWGKLDGLFFKNYFFSIATFVAGSIMFFILFYLCSEKLSFFNRFANVNCMVIMFVCWLLLVSSNGLAAYLRSHREEPFAISSVLVALYVCFITIYIANFCSINFLFLGYATSFLVFFPWLVWIFIKKRQEHF